ncbi:MAG: Tim44/TimA family putative adaptor protein [Alphaproteobacteria bacterium]
MDLLILACIAFYIGYKLYKSLGDNRYDNDISEENKKAFEDFKNSIVKEIEATAEKSEELIVRAEYEAHLSENIRQFLDEYRQKHSSFSLDKFLKGSANAFKMILDSYAKQELNTLKNLVSDKVLKVFNNDIENLTENAQTRYITIVSVKSIDAIDAYIKDEIAYLNVNIASEQIVYVLDNVSGELVSGSQTKIKNCEDKWLFYKPLNAKSNMWQLVEIN